MEKFLKVCFAPRGEDGGGDPEEPGTDIPGDDESGTGPRPPHGPKPPGTVIGESAVSDGK